MVAGRIVALTFALAFGLQSSLDRGLRFEQRAQLQGVAEAAPASPPLRPEKLELTPVERSPSSPQARSRLRNPYRMVLTNHGDVQYTGTISIGGQTLEATFDTGSYDLLVLSHDCAACTHHKGKHKTLYDRHLSSTYHKGSREAEHQFGNGSMSSYDGYEVVSMGPLVVEKQHFWEVFDANIPSIRYSPFGAIVGLGPPDKKKFAAEHGEDDTVQGRISADLLVRGQFRDPEITMVEQYSTLLEHLTITTFSICIGTRPLSPGYLVLDDVPAAERKDAQFTKVDMIGHLHWAASLSSMHLGAEEGQHDPKRARDIGCFTSGCTVVFDSGTSLIAAPRAALKRVADAMMDLRLNCSNLDQMPHLHFNLGGKDFSLPPEAYFGVVIGEDWDNDGDIEVTPEEVGPIRRLNPFDKMDFRDCVPLLTELDLTTDKGDELWVFGLPFFRKYYSTFGFNVGDDPRPASRFGNSRRDLGLPPRRTLSVVEAVDDCLAETAPPEDEAAAQLSESPASPKERSLAALPRVRRKPILAPWLRAALRHGEPLAI